MAQELHPLFVHRGPELHNPFAVPAPERLADDAEAGSFSYAIVPSGPPVASEEVELVHAECIEVTIAWGTNVLHVAHLSPARSFYVGERTIAHAPTDFFIPSEVLGDDRVPLVLVQGGQASLVVPAGARGHIEVAGKRVALATACASAPACAEARSARLLELAPGARACLEIGAFAFRVARLSAGKPSPRAIASGDRGLASSFALTLFATALSVVAGAAFVPHMDLTDEAELDRDRFIAIQQYLNASAERERLNTPDPTAPDQRDAEGGTGTRAKAEEGKMGRYDAPAASKRWAAKGPESNRDVQLAKTMTVAEAREFGLIGLLNSGVAGDPNAPTVPWGGDITLGNDPISARGNMFGAELGDAPGGGLGLSGIGEGGGGRGLGIGLGFIGTYGHGAGLGLGQGWGNSAGRLTQGHATRVPRARPGPIKLGGGRLPPEVVQRVVRQNFGRFRQCYESALVKNPNLEGRVAARFVIDRTGAVSNVGNGGSDLPDSGAVSCVLGAFYGLSFPAPDDGIVTVVYPIAFSPG